MPLLTEGDAQALADQPVVNEQDSFDFHNPPESLQVSFTGTSFKTAFMEASSFLNHIFEKIEHDSGPINWPGKRVLDFGSGWGRMLRLLRSKPELEKTLLYGCEQHPGVIRLCQKTLPEVWITKTGPYPPCDLRSGLIDIVY